MIRDAIERIVEMNKPYITEISGFTYSDKQMHRVDQPSVITTRLSTLDSLIALMNDTEERESMLLGIVHVESPTRVTVKSCVQEGFYRDKYFECEAQLPKIFFDTYLSAENFNIMLQSNFLPNDDREKVLKIVGNIRSEHIETIGDDGISQQVEVKAGIARVATAGVPNPVTLKPFRTFLEVDQPESAFVLRMKDGPQAALFEADGGKWKTEAMKNIQKYLQNRLPEGTLVIA